MSQPQVKVGIMSSPAIRFVFPTAYGFGGQTVEGAQEATLSDGKVLWGGALYDSVEFTPCDAENGSFELIDVTIGVNFHWERKENQSFRGSLRIIVEGDKLTAVNILPIEEYLLSVISSEMSATASLELLKAHAVISRSWLLAQIEKNKQLAAEETPYNPCTRTEGELVRWYDREDHVNFDVCADDHCQRYQGITRESTATVRDAIKATWGQVLTYDGTLCDARFSKSCGGVFEQFENCWEPKHYHYLVARLDNANAMDYPTLRSRKMPESGYFRRQPHSATPPTSISSRRCSTATTRRPPTSTDGRWSMTKPSCRVLCASAAARTMATSST